MQALTRRVKLSPAGLKIPHYARGTRFNTLWPMSGSEHLTTSNQATPIDSALVTNYVDSFYGFGNWGTKIWFIGIEEAGGWRQRDIHQRLQVWDRNGRAELEDAPTFYPESGNGRWHGPTAGLQPTWAQLIRMLFVARGAPTTNEAILDYQRQHLGSRNGEICLAELLPLPSPGVKEWHYSKWSKLRWLESRERYYAHLLVARAAGLARRIRERKPEVVIFYGTTFLKTWSCISGANWAQAIQRKLLHYTNGRTNFFVTKHPLDPALESGRDSYFQEIGNFLHQNHAKRFVAENPVTRREGIANSNHVPSLPARLDWPSMVGNFILNFGTLDLHVQDFLESHLAPAEFNTLCKRHFQDRVDRMQKYFDLAPPSPEKKREVEKFFARLEPVRDLRNHIAHGVLRVALAQDRKTWVMTVTLPRDLSGTGAPEARHLTFDALLDATKSLRDLIEDFQRLFGMWVTDFEVSL